jgi:hypothetical protein
MGMRWDAPPPPWELGAKEGRPYTSQNSKLLKLRFEYKNSLQLPASQLGFVFAALD